MRAAMERSRRTEAAETFSEACPSPTSAASRARAYDMCASIVCATVCMCVHMCM